MTGSTGFCEKRTKCQTFTQYIKRKIKYIDHKCLKKRIKHRYRLQINHTAQRTKSYAIKILFH